MPSISKTILLSVPKSIFAWDEPYPITKDVLYMEVLVVWAAPKAKSKVLSTS